MSTTKEKVAIYARVSPGGDATERLEKQLNALVKYCYESGYDPDGSFIYTDIATAAGRGIEGRLGFTSLIEDTEEKKFKTILVWGLDRLARSAESRGHLIHAVKKYRLKIVDASTATFFSYRKMLPLSFALAFTMDKKRARRRAHHEQR